MTDQVKTRSRAGSSGIRRGEGIAGWLFTAPIIIILGVFLFIPVLMALWVSFSDWNGRGSPLSSSVELRRTGELRRRDDRRRSHRTQLRPLAAQQRLVRVARGAAADRAVALPGGAREPRDPPRTRVLPHRVLLPVGDEFRRHHDPVALPLLEVRGRQPGPVVDRHQRTELVLRTARHHPPRHGPRTARRPQVAADEPVPRCHLVGVDRRTLRRDERLHPDGASSRPAEHSCCSSSRRCRTSAPSSAKPA